MSMERQSHPNLWLQLLRDAVAEESVPDGPHFLDDDDFLDRWENQQLAAGEHDALVEHLADCGYCRDVLAEMIREEAIRLPSVASAAAEECEKKVGGGEGPAVHLPPKHFLWTRMPYVALAVTACVLVVVAMWPGGSDIDDQLALVQQDLRNDPDKALTRLEQLLDDKSSQAARLKAAELAERAGYLSACDLLTSGQFEQIGDLERRVDRLGGRSGQLLNPRIQLDHDSSIEPSLASRANLHAHGYELTGRGLTKSFGTKGNETTSRWERDLLDAIKQFPDDLALRLNLGHLLLNLGRADEATEQFTEAHELESDSVLAHIGLGLAAFE